MFVDYGHWYVQCSDMAITQLLLVMDERYTSRYWLQCDSVITLQNWFKCIEGERFMHVLLLVLSNFLDLNNTF